MISLGIVTCYRGGKDLKVGLFGVDRVLQKQSPYQNPTDLNRPIYRYAPGYAILQYPFLLKSKLIDTRLSYVFEDIVPSVIAWYLASVLAFVASMLLLPKIIPSPSEKIVGRNLQISVILAFPLIVYELSNCQNKLMALFFMLLAIYLFERKKMFLSSLSFNIAMTIYIPLVFFAIYFILKGRMRFILSFITGFAAVFFILPSLVYGFDFNNFLLWDWFTRCLKPFSLTNSYASYMDVRLTSQSLPSVLGRIFISDLTGHFKYLLSPLIIHKIIKFFSGLIILLSVFSALGAKIGPLKGLAYSIFLILALVLPSYCLVYTWSWLFVIYFAILNYAGQAGVPKRRKDYLITMMYIVSIASYSAAVPFLNRFSVLFWATLFTWFSMTFILLKEISIRQHG